MGPSAVLESARVDLAVEGGAVPAEAGGLRLDLLALRHLLEEPLEQVQACSGGISLSARVAHELVPLVAVHAAARGIHLHDPTLEVVDEQSVRHGVEDLTVDLLALPEPARPEAVLCHLPDHVHEGVDLLQSRVLGVVGSVPRAGVVERQQAEDLVPGIAHHDEQAVVRIPAPGALLAGDERGGGAGAAAGRDETDVRARAAEGEQLPPLRDPVGQGRLGEALPEPLLHVRGTAGRPVGDVLPEVVGHEGRLPRRQRGDLPADEVEQILEIVVVVDVGQRLVEGSGHGFLRRVGGSIPQDPAPRGRRMGGVRARARGGSPGRGRDATARAA